MLDSEELHATQSGLDHHRLSTGNLKIEIYHN